LVHLLLFRFIGHSHSKFKHFAVCLQIPKTIPTIHPAFQNFFEIHLSMNTNKTNKLICAFFLKNKNPLSSFISCHSSSCHSCRIHIEKNQCNGSAPQKKNNPAAYRLHRQYENDERQSIIVAFSCKLGEEKSMGVTFSLARPAETKMEITIIIKHKPTDKHCPEIKSCHESERRQHIPLFRLMAKSGRLQQQL